MIWLKAGLLLVALGIGYAIVTSYNSAISEAEIARTQAATFEAAFVSELTKNRQLMTANKQLNDTLKAKSDEEQAMRLSLHRLAKGLAELKRDDPVVRDWADAPIPDVVRQRLRDRAAPTAQRN
jgi:LysB family phage lysis regulatory protein